MNKICRDCKSDKPLGEYYVHVRMADGHLNKCKECVKKRVKGYWADGRGKEYDKRRQKDPKRKEWQRKYSLTMSKKYKKKKSVRSKFWWQYRKGAIKKLPCEECGTEGLVEAHHPDYDKPFEVMWLCSKHHKEWHRNNEPKNQF